MDVCKGYCNLVEHPPGQDGVCSFQTGKETAKAKEQRCARPHLDRQYPMHLGRPKACIAGHTGEVIQSLERFQAIQAAVPLGHLGPLQICHRRPNLALPQAAQMPFALHLSPLTIQYYHQNDSLSGYSHAVC